MMKNKQYTDRESIEILEALLGILPKKSSVIIVIDEGENPTRTFKLCDKTGIEHLNKFYNDKLNGK